MGNRLESKNYRPIANLCSFSKIYEKLVLDRLENKTSNLIGLSQHGFRANHSTESAMLEIQSIISNSIDSGLSVAAYSIDLSAAFDMLREDILQEKLRVKISEGLLFTVSDFLRNRRIVVDIDGIKSEPLSLNIGCMQGSSLGPRLFTTYVGDLKSTINAHHYTSYADDSYVIIVDKTLIKPSKSI